MDWFHALFASICCRTSVEKFNFPNEPVLEWKRDNSILWGHIISSLKPCRTISKGSIYHIIK